MAESNFDVNEAFARGDARRRQVLGDDYVERSNQNLDELTKAWRRFATEVSWGQVWTRPGLDLKTRSMCTVAALVAVGDMRELKTHVRGALRLGVTPEELAEVFIQIACYAGMPRGGGAFATLKDILSESESGT